MSLNPLNVLKRKLQDESTPLQKRLCMAKNVIQTHHFPVAPKERVIAEWLEVLVENKLSGEEFRGILGWLDSAEDITEELKSKFIKLTSQYLQTHQLGAEDIPSLLSLIENDKISSQLNIHIEEYCFITKSLLKFLKTNDTKNNPENSKVILNGIIKYYKESKKKLEFVEKLLDGDNIETIFEYLDNSECRGDVINICQTILFPMSKKSFFAVFLRTILQKEDLDDFSAETGDNIQSVIKVMSVFYAFPKGRTSNDYSFLQKFIYTFVNSFKTESQLIFTFYVMVANCLNIEQNYISSALKMPTIPLNGNHEKIKRNLFLSMLEVLLENEIDVTVKLIDTLGGSKVHIKKNFMSFLQSIMMGQLKLEGKPDKTSLQIIKTAIKLDPTLIESKINQILPPLMVAKKNNIQTQEPYVEMLNCLLEILFKLSRGIIFMNQILPHLKIALEASNTEQFELQQKLKELIETGNDVDKIQAKIINGQDIFPKDCIETYGKLTSELMFRQNTELFLTLQKDFEEHCLMMLEEGFVSPSIITLTQVLSAILSSFFERNKMADHTVPQQIAEEFWTAFQNFETDLLKKFGESLLKLNHNPNLTLSYLQLCTSYTQLKLLNTKYSPYKVKQIDVSDTSEVLDLSGLLSCLNKEQWITLTGKVQDYEGVLALDNLLLTKAIAAELQKIHIPEDDQTADTTKTHLIKEVSANINILEQNPNFPKVLYKNLNHQQLKQLAKTLIKESMDNPEKNLLKSEAVFNKPLLNALVLETLRNISKILENGINLENYPSLSKAMAKSSFDFTSFIGEIKNVPEYFEAISVKREFDHALTNYIEILKQLQIYYLEANYQLAAIFLLLTAKKAAESKKLKKGIDNLLLSIFELSPKHPDMYKIFPLEFIFDFETRLFIELVTLKIKTSNPLFVIKCLLETAVKKVKTDSDVVKLLVKIILNNQKVKKEESSNIEYFSDKVFQISCLVLPIIAKEKRAITTSNYRSILAELQEKLHKALLKSFKSINFDNEKSKILAETGNPEDSVVITENMMATLNAMEAFSLTLSKYCEANNAEDVKSLDYLWTGLEYFVQNAISAIQNSESKTQHIESSIQLLNVVLRNIKKLETHTIFQNRDKIFKQVWQSLKSRLLQIFGEKGRNLEKKHTNDSCLDDIQITVKFLSELISVDGFAGSFNADLFNLMVLKKHTTKPEELKSQLTSHQVANYLWNSCLKGNIIDKKCLAMSKTISRSCKNLSLWIRQNYESEIGGNGSESVVKVDDIVCDIVRVDLDTLSDVILAAKKIPLNYKFIDAIFESQHMVQYIMDSKTSGIRCEVSWQSYFNLAEGLLNVLNSLLLGREELLEDRWPCYLQCYRALISSICDKSTSLSELDRWQQERLADIGHSVEKLTQSICKRKTHISRLAAYTVGDICSFIEKSGPIRPVRQHLENAIALLIQASDSTYAMAFLRRALAGAPGHVTMTNMYTNYKRYHKYTGNA